MSRPIRVSRQTRQNWLIDAAVALGGLLAGLSGIYFLFLPSGGYRGGRNAAYGLYLLFSRHTWSDLHAWGGVLMIASVAVHLAVHWHWVKRMARRVVSALRPEGSPLSRGAVFNVAVDALIAVSFLICGLSGIYLLFLPEAGLQGGANAGWDPGLLLCRTAWDLIHTWSGVVLIAAAVVHFAIHWCWVRKVTPRFILSLLPQHKVSPEALKAT